MTSRVNGNDYGRPDTSSSNHWQKPTSENDNIWDRNGKWLNGCGSVFEKTFFEQVPVRGEIRPKVLTNKTTGRTKTRRTGTATDRTACPLVAAAREEAATTTQRPVIGVQTAAQVVIVDLGPTDRCLHR